jgi:hypothetical protein
MDYLETVLQVATWLADLPDWVKALGGVTTLVGAYHATKGIARNGWWLSRLGFRAAYGPEAAGAVARWWHRPTKAMLAAQANAARMDRIESTSMETAAAVSRLAEAWTSPATKRSDPRGQA